MNAVMGWQNGETAPIVPLVLSMEVCEIPENVTRNLRETFATQYEPLNAYLGSQTGIVSVCGSGPSFAFTYKDIEGDVMACNGAHRFLLEKGIVPKYTVFFDAAEVMAEFAVPHPDVTYLIASRCHRKVFDRLKDCKVVVWHIKGDEGTDTLLEEYGRMEPMIHGGTAAVTRSMFLAACLGYTEIHLHGADSSHHGNETHLRKSLVPEKDIMIFVNHRWFKTSPWMAAQVEDLKILAPQMKELGCKLVVHGFGLLPYVAGIIGLECRATTQLLEETNGTTTGK